MAIASSGEAWANVTKAGWPASRALMMPLSRGISVTLPSLSLAYKKKGPAHWHRTLLEQSGGQELNLRPLAPHASALPDCATARVCARLPQQDTAWPRRVPAAAGVGKLTARV